MCEKQLFIKMNQAPPLLYRPFTVSFSSLFGCLAHNYTVLIHSHRSHNKVFGHSRQPIKKL